MAQPDNLLEQLVTRVLDVLGKALPASTLGRFADQLRPALDAALAPFQVLRREDFDGYVAQLERLEAQVAELRDQVAELEAR